jgi:Major tropism determinant N-terminal domain
MAYKRILLRRDTASNWTSGNPVLASGELGYETNTGKFKIGNGSTAWNSLSYTVNAAMSGVTLNDVGDVTITSAANGDFLRWNGTAWVNDAVNLSTDTIGSYVESLVAGNGITLTNNSGEGATPTIAVTSNTFAPIDSPTFTGTVTLPDNTVALGTKTTGSYVSSLVAGTGVTLTNNSGESATPTVAIGQAVATDSNVTFNDVIVSGNLTVSGTTTSVNTETLTVNDNIVVLNNNVTGAPTENAGLEVERGSSTNVLLRWNETTDVWEITTDGTTYGTIATTGDVTTATGAISVDNLSDATITSVANGQFLKYNGTAWVNDAIDLGTDTTGNYVSDVTAGTGITVTHTPGEGSSAAVAVDTTVIAPLASPTFTGTVTLPTGTVTSTMIADGTIVNADISASAAIALSKLATSTAGNIIVYNSSGVPTSVTETGDVTISDAGVTAIGANKVLPTMLAKSVWDDANLILATQIF